MKAGAALLAAVIVFVVGMLVTDVKSMLNSEYCFDHDARPSDASFHEEELSFLPPGPRCRYTTDSGDQVVVGPGWTPAVLALLAIASALATSRWFDHRRSAASDRSR